MAPNEQFFQKKKQQKKDTKVNEKKWKNLPGITVDLIWRGERKALFEADGFVLQAADEQKKNTKNKRQEAKKEALFYCGSDAICVRNMDEAA